MELSKLDKWFTNLTVKQKEHIARKILLSAGIDQDKATYPGCTEIWINLSNDRKVMIYEHCTDKHGMFIDPEKKYNTLGHDF